MNFILNTLNNQEMMIMILTMIIENYDDEFYNAYV